MICELEFESATEVASKEDNITDGFSIKQFPNPFNATTNIQITIPKADVVKISIYNSIGQLIHSEERKITPGIYTYYFNANQFSSGIYFYHLATREGLTKSGKMILLK